jgi:hypothetical protein
MSFSTPVVSEESKNLFTHPQRESVRVCVRSIIFCPVDKCQGSEIWMLENWFYLILPVQLEEEYSATTFAWGVLYSNQYVHIVLLDYTEREDLVHTWWFQVETHTWYAVLVYLSHFLLPHTPLHIHPQSTRRPFLFRREWNVCVCVLTVDDWSVPATSTLLCNNGAHLSNVSWLCCTRARSSVNFNM